MKSIKNAFSPLFSKATDELSALRSEIADVKSRIEALNEAPLPFADALVKLNAYIDAVPDDVQLADFVRRDISVPHISLASNLGALEVAVRLAGREAIRAHLTAQLKAEVAARPAGLSDADFAAAKAALVSKLRELETREEAFIRDAETAGMSVTRRADMDLTVALDVR